ncbi:hypothetical protein [Caproiciproducens sp.]
MSAPVYCKGCIYRSNAPGECSTCDYMYYTGHPRGCHAGPNCTKYTSGGKQKKDIIIKPTKRVKLTDAERREHRNALRRKEYAKKKAALSLQTESGAVENISI